VPGPFDPAAGRLSGQVAASNSKTRGKVTRERFPSSLPLAASQGKGASRRLFSQRFHAGLAYAAPPFDAAAGSASGQDGAGGLGGMSVAGRGQAWNIQL